MVKFPENMQSQFKLAEKESTQRSGFVELITLWFVYAFAVGCFGLFWGTTLSIFPFLFFIATGIIQKRSRKESTHNTYEAPVSQQAKKGHAEKE